MKGWSTSLLSDALDKLDLPGSVSGLRPLARGMRTCGPAFTVRYVPRGFGANTVGDFLDDVPAGHVVVIDNYGRTDCTVWGDLMTAAAHARGIKGTVISGVCRDSDAPVRLGYPMFGLGCFMRTGKDRVELAEAGAAVSIGGVRVLSGDMVYGDSDGVVVVPADCHDAVRAAAQAIEQSEAELLADLQSGMPLARARQRHGYHSLQARDLRVTQRPACSASGCRREPG